ncbi:MAG TPA: AMP-binding protein [Actinomycetes bacterium]|jgi:acyl-coenzyme A synthetase/AMP-(fatty) acid ligase|nr:AMP-binding protein [Actinomycetes bacterium]
MRDLPPNMTDYLATRASFRLEVPEVYNYARDVVDAWASREPGKLALLAVGPDGGSPRRHSFADLAASSNRAANYLTARGVRKGDRVFVMLPRIADWYDVILGCIKLGAVPMPGTTLLTARDIAYRLERAGATVAITDAPGAAKVDVAAEPLGLEPLERLWVGDPRAGEEVPSGWTSWNRGLEAASERPPDAEPTRSHDPLLIYFTSGTVAYPKMVLHTQASCGIGHQITARFWQDLKPTDLHWTLSDFGWAKAAWGKLFGQWALGAANFLWDLRGKPDYDLLLRLIGDHRVSTFCAPPTVFRALVLEDLSSYDWSGLRHCVSAGEPLNPEVIKVWREATGLTIYDGYGQTETVNLLANYRCLQVRPGSMGKPTPGFDVCVVDDGGKVLGAGEEGHVAVRVSPERPVGLFREYWRDAEATAAAFRDEWYYTGDRATTDEDGYFWFVGRADDVIISAAYRIGPFEVESTLVEHEAVVEAAVVGKPDPERGQIVKAFVVLAPGRAGSKDLIVELQDHCKRVSAPYKYPREIEFVEELPKTISGKIRRVELRERGIATSTSADPG